MTTGAAPPLITVGVDGSATSIEALRWAGDHARLIEGEIHAVLAWEIPFTIFVVPLAVESDYAGEARTALEKAVAEVFGDQPDVPVILRVVEGRTAQVLMNEAAHADLLVIGSHGRGELPGMHLGSVASYCVHHAPCPVVVMRHHHAWRPEPIPSRGGR